MIISNNYLKQIHILEMGMGRPLNVSELLKPRLLK